MTTIAPADLSTGLVRAKWSTLEPSEATIRFDSVVKRYPDGTTAVDEISLVCPARRLTAFVGPSGCGKTTSLRMINRMIEPTSGSIRIGDVDTRKLEENSLRRQMGYVIQNAGLFPHRRVIDNIATVPRMLGTSRREARTRAEELMAIVGLDPSLASRFPYQLSGGQQQRVGVARALAADPPVLLMDEPFSAIDPIVRVELQQELLRLQSEIGKTIVFVTHDIDEAVRLADQVVVFQRNGSIAQAASPAAVLTNPANDFVSQLVGRDAGLRWLSLLSTRYLPRHSVSTVGAGRESEAADWTIRVDDSGRPLEWVRSRRGGDVETEPLTVRSGDVTLRDLMDQLVTAQRGVVALIDDRGALETIVTSDDLHRAIVDERAATS